MLEGVSESAYMGKTEELNMFCIDFSLSLKQAVVQHGEFASLFDMPEEVEWGFFQLLQQPTLQTSDFIYSMLWHKITNAQYPWKSSAVTVAFSHSSMITGKVKVHRTHHISFIPRRALHFVGSPPVLCMHIIHPFASCSRDRRSHCLRLLIPPHA